MAATLYLKALVAAVAALTMAIIAATPGHAQDMSAELEQFNATCFTESGEFEGTDGCFEWAEANIELENLLESIEKGCVLSEMYEDYSCKGPSAPSSPSYTEQHELSEQGTQVSEQGCFVVDMKSDEVSGEDIDVLTQQYGFDVEAGNPDELLYSPACFEQGVVEWDESMLENPCYDVVGTTLETAVPEYIGCLTTSLSEPASTPLSTQVSGQDWPTPLDADQAENLKESKAKGCTPANLFEDLSCKGPQYKGYEKISERPVTQQGTLAPKDWKSHVTPVKPANPLEKDSSAKRTPLAIQYSPVGASAQCYDGTYSTSIGSGTCSGHGGIYTYLTQV